MKKKLFIIGAFILVSCAFTSCSKTCKTCREAVYVDGSYDHNAKDPQEYCGAELLTIEAIQDVTIGNTTTKWECN